MKRLLSAIIFCVWLSANLFAQTSLLRELLDLPAPPPVSKTEDETGETRRRSEDFYDKKNVPPDDAPIEDLIDFWKRQNFIADSHPNKIKPREKTLARLLESVKEKPENLTNFLTLFPVDEQITAVVKDIYDAQNLNFNEDWRKSIKEWLKYKSSYFSDELFAEAQNAKDHKIYKTIGKEPELRALANADWERAKPLLERLAADKDNPRTAFFAGRLFYEHAIEKKDSATIEKYRNDFQKIVENKSATGRERDDALEALIQNKKWQNHEDWFVSLFSDETLLEVNIGDRTTTHPLDGIVYKNPDKWIPIMAKLVESDNRNVRSAAVQALVQFQNQTARKDALLPLLPWLTNPEWAKDTGMGRHRLIQSFDFIDIPEGVLSLIWIVENDEIYADWAADSLAKYKDPRAVPAIKAALAKSKDEDERKRFLNGLIASGGLTDEEQAAALENYAEKISTPEGFQSIEETYRFDEENIPSLQISTGKYLARQTEPGENLIRLLIERQKILQKEKPETAKILSGIMSKWQGRLIDLEMLNRIADGKADAETVVGALARRKELKERVLNELYALRGESGLAGAVAACLLEEQSGIVSAFHSRNIETQIGTLACARLLRAKLPIHEVGVLLDSPNELTALAAERYLESEDGAEARNFVLAKHAGEALILGARDSFNPAKQSVFSATLGNLFASVDASYGNHLHPDAGNFADIDKFEDKLRGQIKTDKNLLEIYAVAPTYVVRVYKDRAVLTWFENAARFRERTLEKEELDDLRRFFADGKFEETPPIFGKCHHDCAAFEYAHLNRDGGRRFFAYTNFSAFLAVWLKFQVLRQSNAMRLHYYLQDKVRGLEVLLTDEKFLPKAVWKNGDDFRILVSDEARKNEVEKEIDKLNAADEKNEDLDWRERDAKRFEHQTERAFEQYEWREFKDGKLGAKIDEPLEIPFLRDKLSFPASKDLRANESVGQSKSGNYEIRAGEYSTGGLWKVNRLEQIEIKKGVYANPFVVGNWIIAAKADEDWSAPNQIVRVNLRTGKELKINLPPADEFYPIAFVAARGKILLYRARDANKTNKDNPSPKNAPEYYLLDAATGETERAKGEFQPLVQQTFRSLQPTGKPFEFWAAIPNRTKNETDIGVYDAKNFTFKSVFKVPEILLDSMDVWVDERAAKVYFVYAGEYGGGKAHLLSLPLTSGK